MSESRMERPEWLPDEYDPDAPVDERVPIMADIGGGIELHVQGENGTTEIVGSPQYFGENDRYMYLYCGPSAGSWSWEVRVPKGSDRDPYLEKCDPDQDIEAYEATKRRWLSDIDVRMYGVDTDRLEGDS